MIVEVVFAEDVMLERCVEMANGFMRFGLNSVLVRFPIQKYTCTKGTFSTHDLLGGILR